MLLIYSYDQFQWIYANCFPYYWRLLNWVWRNLIIVWFLAVARSSINPPCMSRCPSVCLSACLSHPRSNFLKFTKYIHNVVGNTRCFICQIWRSCWPKTLAKGVTFRDSEQSQNTSKEWPETAIRSPDLSQCCEVYAKSRPSLNHGKGQSVHISWDDLPSNL